MNDADAIKAIRAVMESARADKHTGEIEIRLVYGHGGVRDCLFMSRKKIEFYKKGIDM